MNEFVIFDTEYTSWQGCMEKGRADWQKEEIVQIAAIKVNSNLAIESEFNVYVKPQINPVLSDYFINLTGITNQMVQNNGIDFLDAYQQFKAFSKGLVCLSHSWSAGPNNIADGSVMVKNLDFNNAQDPNPPQYKNIAPWFQKKYKEKNINISGQSSGQIAKLLGVEKNIKKLGIDEHNAVYDVYSILEGLRYLGFSSNDL